MFARTGSVVAVVVAMSALIGWAPAQNAARTKPSAKGEAIMQVITKLRTMPDDERAAKTKELALDIRTLTDPSERLSLAAVLSNLATEGDFGRDTLQTVTTTLDQALEKSTGPVDDFVCDQLAALERYEGMTVHYAGKPLAAARKRLADLDAKRATVDFTLKDLDGKEWTLSKLKGKVVLVNFWATWCPPCRKEMPDIEQLSKEFKDQGLVVLAISDEKQDVVEKFIKEKGYTYPVLLDPGREVAGKRYEVSGIPKNFIYDREGRLVAQSIDMRTRRQFLALLAKAGLKERKG